MSTIQDARRKKFINLILDIFLLVIGGWMIFSIGQFTLVALTFFLLICVAPILCENIGRYLWNRKKTAAKKAP